MHARLSYLIPRLGMMFFGVLLALIMTEFTLRRFAPQPTYSRVQTQSPRFYQDSDWIPYTLRPNFNGRLGDYEGGMAFLLDERQVTTYEVTTNSLGFRDTEFSASKPTGIYRIMILGDSFTFGFSLDDGYNYPAVVELCLQNSAQIEIINAGFASSYSPDSYYVYHREISPTYEPDMIIVGYFIGNDFLDMMDTVWIGETSGLPTRVESKTRYVDPAHWWRTRAGLPRYQNPLLRDVHLYQLIVGQLIEWGIGTDYANAGEGYFENYKAVFYPDFQGITAMQTAFDRSMQMLAAMRDLAAERGQNYLVILIPTGVQSDQDLWEQTLNDLPYPTNPATAHPQKRIQDFLEAEQIPYLDLLPSFREPSDEALYLGRDGHWSEAGMFRASDVICQYLKDHLGHPE